MKALLLGACFGLGAFALGWIGRSQRQATLERRRLRRFIRAEVDRVFDSGMRRLAREGHWMAQAYLAQEGREECGCEACQAEGALREAEREAGRDRRAN